MEDVRTKKLDIEKATHLLKAAFFDIEEDNSISVDEKLKTIIHATSAVCAGIAIQPIPFADFFILTPIQILMIVHMTKVIRKDFLKKEKSENSNIAFNQKSLDASNILVTITSALGVGIFAQQGIIGLYKTVLPFMGAITTIPLVYGTTFAIGSAAKMVIYARLQGENLEKDFIRKHFKETLKSKEKEIKAKEDLNEYLNSEVNKLDKENAKIKGELELLEKELEEVNENIQKAYEGKNSLVTLIEDNNQIRNEIYDAIDSAESKIYISIFDISEYTLLEKLEEKSRQGVEIKIITDYRKVMAYFKEGSQNSLDSSKGSYSEKTIKRIKNCFRQNNITVKLFGENLNGINHQKDIVIDGKCLISGSANFTRKGLNDNKETVFYITDSRLVNQRIDSFNSLFNSNELLLLDKNLLK